MFRTLCLECFLSWSSQIKSVNSWTGCAGPHSRVEEWLECWGSVWRHNDLLEELLHNLSSLIVKWVHSLKTLFSLWLTPSVILFFSLPPQAPSTHLCSAILSHLMMDDTVIQYWWLQAHTEKCILFCQADENPCFLTCIQRRTKGERFLWPK